MTWELGASLKTWRKQNVAMILATQSSEDLTRSAMLRVVVESCATKILLANPNLDRQAYRELFGLNDTEIDLVAGLIPRQQLLVKRSDLSKVLNLHVDADAEALYTNAPDDGRGGDHATRPAQTIHSSSGRF